MACNGIDVLQSSDPQLTQTYKDKKNKKYLRILLSFKNKKGKMNYIICTMRQNR